MRNLKILGLIGGVGAIALLLATPRPTPLKVVQSPAAIPANILPCLPPAQRQELKAVVQSGTTTYYAIGSYQPEYRQFLVRRDRHHRCQNLMSSDALLPDNFFSAYVSRELAQQLMLQIYTRALERTGGIELFQQQFQAAAAQLPPQQFGYLSPEQGWAFQQLQIQLPRQIRVVTLSQYRQILNADSYDRFNNATVPSSTARVAGQPASTAADSQWSTAAGLPGGNGLALLARTQARR